MAFVGQHVAGSGIRVALPNHTLSVTDAFPTPNRENTVESSVASREIFDTLPVNQTLNKSLTDNYLEFRISGVEGVFLDLSNLMLEMDVSITGEDGVTPLDAEQSAVFVNGLGGSGLFKGVSVFMNDQLVEANPLFSYWGFIKSTITMSPNQVARLGRISFYYRDYKGSGIKRNYTEDYFTGANKLEKSVIRKVLDSGVRVCSPVMLDVTSMSEFLLDNVSFRLRLELTSNAYAINTHTPNNNYKYRINWAKLWVDRVVPYSNALQALNRTMISENSKIHYIYNKTLYKSYILGSGQTSIVLDMPWSMTIPECLYMVIVDLDAMSGTYNLNPVYFQHADLSKVHITINGQTIYNISCAFPDNVANLYYTTLRSLGLNTDHLVAYDAFVAGRTILAFGFESEIVESALPVEKNGNLRINLEFSSSSNKNRAILLFGDTKAVLSIDSDRRIVSDVRA